jgi:hypothetical protein
MGPAASRLVFIGRWIGACVLLAACSPPAKTNRIGPQGGLVASEDDGLSIVIWPGALGRYEDFEIVATNSAPDSYGQAYQVRPNVELSVAAEVIVRGDLPADLSMARVGALSAADVAQGEEMWRTLPYRAGYIDEQAGTIRAYDTSIALYYAMIDNGVDPEPGTSSETGDATGDTSTGDTMDPTFPDNPTYEADIAPLWVGVCDGTACHGAGAAGGLVLTGDSYDNLVNAPSTTGDFTLVVPGNRNMSFLVAKLEGPPMGLGDQMPQGAPPLDQLTQNVVIRWITDGAPR